MSHESTPNSIRPRLPALSAVTLAADYSDDNSFTVSLIAPGDTRLDTTDKYGKIMLYITFTLAAGQNNNDLIIKVESGNSTSSLYKLTTISTAAGVGTITETTLKFTGASDSAPYTIAVPVDIFDRVTKFSFKEENSTAFSTLSVDYALVARN